MLSIHNKQLYAHRVVGAMVSFVRFFNTSLKFNAHNLYANRIYTVYSNGRGGGGGEGVFSHEC
jgi:hypothetical protein